MSPLLYRLSYAASFNACSLVTDKGMNMQVAEALEIYEYVIGKLSEQNPNPVHEQTVSQVVCTEDYFNTYVKTQTASLVAVPKVEQKIIRNSCINLFQVIACFLLTLLTLTVLCYAYFRETPSFPGVSKEGDYVLW